MIALIVGVSVMTLVVTIQLLQNLLTDEGYLPYPAGQSQHASTVRCLFPSFGTLPLSIVIVLSILILSLSTGT